MRLYISNAFSLSMLDRDAHRAEARNRWGGDATKRPTAITAEEAIARIAGHQKFGLEIVSVVGHADTAKILGEILGIDLQANRVSVKLGAEDCLLVGQYSGPRLPEGATALPEGAKIEWWIIG